MGNPRTERNKKRKKEKEQRRVKFPWLIKYGKCQLRSADIQTLTLEAGRLRSEGVQDIGLFILENGVYSKMANHTKNGWKQIK